MGNGVLMLAFHARDCFRAAGGPGKLSVDLHLEGSMA